VEEAATSGGERKRAAEGTVGAGRKGTPAGRGARVVTEPERERAADRVAGQARRVARARTVGRYQEMAAVRERGADLIKAVRARGAEGAAMGLRQAAVRARPGRLALVKAVSPATRAAATEVPGAVLAEGRPAGKGRVAARPETPICREVEAGQADRAGMVAARAMGGRGGCRSRRARSGGKGAGRGR
jgi:hypothetical protein